MPQGVFLVSVQNSGVIPSHCDVKSVAFFPTLGAALEKEGNKRRAHFTVFAVTPTVYI